MKDEHEFMKVIKYLKVQSDEYRVSFDVVYLHNSLYIQEDITNIKD